MPLRCSPKSRPAASALRCSPRRRLCGDRRRLFSSRTTPFSSIGPLVKPGVSAAEYRPIIPHSQPGEWDFHRDLTRYEMSKPNSSVQEGGTAKLVFPSLAKFLVEVRYGSRALFRSMARVCDHPDSPGLSLGCSVLRLGVSRSGAFGGAGGGCESLAPSAGAIEGLHAQLRCRDRSRTLVQFPTGTGDGGRGAGCAQFVMSGPFRRCLIAVSSGGGVAAVL